MRHGIRSTVFALLALVAAAPHSTLTSQSRQKALTLENITGRQTGARQAVISPDGKRVAITGDSSGGSGIYLANPTDLSSSPTFWMEGSATAWFPDSSRL